MLSHAGLVAPHGGVDEAECWRWTLTRELNMMGRGLANSWSDRLEAVSTVVRLGDDAAQEQVLRAVCRQVAGEFGLQQTVRRGGEVWHVRFSRAPVADETMGMRGTSSRPGANRALPARLARPYHAARRVCGALIQRRAGCP